MRIVWKFIFIISMVTYCFDSPAVADQSDKKFSAETFGKITVLENGRKKPFDSYARNKLIQFSGKQKLKGSSALEWMTRLIFNPSAADKDPVFLINNPDVADAIGISPKVKRRYSFADLQNGLGKIGELSERAMKEPSEQWSSFDKEIIRTRKNLEEYYAIRASFDFLMPFPHYDNNDTSLANLLGIPHTVHPSFIQLFYKLNNLSERMQEIQKKGVDSITSSEMSLFVLAKRLYQTEQSIGNPPPHLIPDITPEGEQWYSMWGLLNVYHTNAMTSKTINLLISMRDAYLTSSQRDFDEYVNQYCDLNKETFKNDRGITTNHTLELQYNKINPFLFTKILYGIAALLSLFTFSLIWKRAYHISVFLVVTGLILHTLGIILRMIIMSHPPVTNLYETFVFTAWVSVVLGLSIEWIKIRPLGIVTASITGFIFLHVASRYGRDGDTMGMLMAVLDSSFWLTTHIVTIALGYAGFVAAGFIAHVYLIQKMFRNSDKDRLALISRALYGIFVFGFIFTVVGTMFGGMWADQAWGRFWGWDPKENGALLIIIWGLIVLHSKIGNVIKDTGFAAGGIVGVVLVMCTWIGVNLLGIGLHSYGFSSTGAGVFFAYIGIECVFLVVSALIISSKKTTENIIQ
jgi:ABC-type transport system involved in cytochrome c biogenesis permease subunit